MRLRNNPKANDILAAHDDIVILDGKQYRGKWNELFGNSNPIYIEIGMGKGDFIIQISTILELKNFQVLWSEL